MIACVALGVVAAHEPTRDDTMEYFGLGEAEPPYDCTGATVAEVVVVVELDADGVCGRPL